MHTLPEMAGEVPTVPFNFAVNPQSAGQAGELRVGGDTTGPDPREWPWW